MAARAHRFPEEWEGVLRIPDFHFHFHRTHRGIILSLCVVRRFPAPSFRHCRPSKIWKSRPSFRIPDSGRLLGEGVGNHNSTQTKVVFHFRYSISGRFRSGIVHYHRRIPRFRTIYFRPESGNVHECLPGLIRSASQILSNPLELYLIRCEVVE